MNKKRKGAQREETVAVPVPDSEATNLLLVRIAGSVIWRIIGWLTSFGAMGKHDKPGKLYGFMVNKTPKLLGTPTVNADGETVVTVEFESGSVAKLCIKLTAASNFLLGDVKLSFFSLQAMSPVELALNSDAVTALYRCTSASSGAVKDEYYAPILLSFKRMAA